MVPVHFFLRRPVTKRGRCRTRSPSLANQVGLKLSAVCFQEWRESFLTLASLVGQVVCSTAYVRPTEGTSRPKVSWETGGSDATELLGGLAAKKWGRSRPFQSFFHGDFRRVWLLKSLRMNAVKQTLGEERGEDEAAECNSYLLHAIHFLPAQQSCWAGATPWVTLATARCPRVGSLQPNTVFCRRPNRKPRDAQPTCSQRLRVTPGVTRTVTQRVKCLVCSTVTLQTIRRSPQGEDGRENLGNRLMKQGAVGAGVFLSRYPGCEATK